MREPTPLTQSHHLTAPQAVQVLDPAPEERFERIIRTARRLFGVPIAFISLIGKDGHWFKSKQGVDNEDLPRWITVAALAGRDAPAIVEDAAADPRLAGSPLLSEQPAVRFFAGCSLHAPDGTRLGTFAVAGHQPRKMDAGEMDALRDMAQWTESELNNATLQQALATARESESRLHAVVDNVADGIITLDEFGKIASINPAAMQIFGYPADELIGQDIKMLMPPTYHHSHDNHLQKFRDTGRTAIIGVDREVTGRRKDGSLFSMELMVNEMWLKGRRGFAGIVRDITARRDSERKLRESSTLLHALMGSTSSFAYVRDMKGRFLFANKEYERVFGFAPGEVLGKTVEDVFSPELAVYNRSMDREVLQGDADTRVEDELQLNDGAQSFLVVRAPLRTETGEVYGVCGVGTDITLRKKAEQFKNEFISTVSHELRTPLTSIRGALGLLTGGVAGDMPERAKSLLDIANNNCERLVRLINDILDIEKIESGHMRFEIATQRMLPLVEQALASTQHFAAQYKVHFELLAEGADAWVAVDGDRLMQVIVNLLSNAAKFSPQGGTVQVRVTQSAGTLRLSVIDHGEGIAPSFRERIFQKFAQADSSDTRQKGGSGLGLSISRAIVERHHGRIDFISEPGVRTEFFVELPTVSGMPKAPHQRGRVLVVEDDQDIARLLGMMLSQAGMTSDIAYDAEEARRMLAANAYEAMTLDLALPREDGLSLLRWMREQEGTRALPVVVVSARAEEGQRTLTGGAVGILDWIPKPIDEVRLLAALQGALRSCKDKAQSVLHVEDDRDVVEVVAAMLRPAYRVTHAGTLAEARERLANEPFSLILLDLLLPDGHGSELLASLSGQNATTPVVVFSVEEANQPMIDGVQAALVKSRTSNAQLLSILHDLVGTHPEKKEVS
jgi:PAS domain S-box-containing protein